MTRAKAGPPMSFDGFLFWYTEWFDTEDDRCCAPHCRQVIPEDDGPLILFKDVERKTWQTRLHVACASRLGLLRTAQRNPRQ